MSAVTWILDYAATNPEETIRYTKSDMVLWTAADASYLSEKNSRSRAGAVFFLRNAPNTNNKQMKPNGPIAVLAKIIPEVMSSAMEAEVASTFLAAKEAVPMRITLEEMGHFQPTTLMQVDNSTAIGFVNDTINYKRSKVIDMRFHWVRDRVQKGQFNIYWVPGK